MATTFDKKKSRSKTTITSRKFVTSKTIFIVTLVVAVLTILSIWLFGLGQHRTIFQNSILSTSILSIIFFLFITVGLYKGIKLKDDVGKLTDKIDVTKVPDLPLGDVGDITDVGDGPEGIIAGILLWILYSVLLLIFIWIFSAVVWTTTLVFIAMLYWIFFRALRLVFKNSVKTKGNLLASMQFGINYTILYNFWIYGIILTSHYLIR